MMFSSTLALYALVAVAEAPTVQWDLTVELETSGRAAPGQVCLVTPRQDAQLDDPWFPAVPLDELVTGKVLTEDRAKRVRLDPQLGDYTPWFDRPLPAHAEPVRQAFAAMRGAKATGDEERCGTRVPSGCEPAWEFAPPALPDTWSWVVACSPPGQGTSADPSVAFVVVRAVDLDRMFMPFVTDFDVFGGSIQVRFDSVRQRGELAAANFQASAGVVGGDYHPTAPVPSFGGRLRLPLRSRCRTQRFRLREDPALPSEVLRTALLYDGADIDNVACAHVPRAAGEGRTSTRKLPGYDRATELDGCRVESADLRRGVFEMKVPVGALPRRHQLDLRVDPAKGPASAAPMCVSSSWADGEERDVIDLPPTAVVLHWRWPCFAETSSELRCPEATVVGGRTCKVDGRQGSDRCTYRCETTRRDGQTVGWPVNVELEHEALGMGWSYALDTVESEIVGTIAPEERRFLVSRGRLHDDTEERWPAWWTGRRGDEIRSVKIVHKEETATVTDLDQQTSRVGSVLVPGSTCRERFEYRYVSERSISRWYNRREVDVTWPYLELPPPSRTAFPLLLAANAGAAVGITSSRRGHPLLYLAGDIAYRGFAAKESQRQRPAWHVGLRYFGFYGRKEYRPLVPPGWEPRTDTVNVWRHGPAAHVGVLLNRRERASSLIGVGTTVGLGWTSAGSGANAEDRIPTDRVVPYVYLASELTLRYRFFRAAATIGVLGPDPTFEYESRAEGGPRRTSTRPYGLSSWLLIPGISVGMEL